VGVGRVARARLVAVPALFVLLAAPVAHADVDWAKGLVTARGVGIANRAAPSPAAARGPARRLAEEAAQKQLAAQLPALPLATGGTLADKLGDATIKAAVDRAVANALTVAAEPETDGSWKVTMAVPIEALRQAVAGGPRAVTDADAGPAVVIVDDAKAAPAIGYTVGGLAAATVFVEDVPAWAKAAPRIKAKHAAKAGAIDAKPGKATEATLFVIVTK